MKTLISIACLGAAVLITGCQSPLPPGAEAGPHGTMAYLVRVDASEPGARLEVNGEDVGNTPVTLKIFGDRDGTFHDFGSYHYTIRALPVTTNQFAQARYFATGHAWTPEDRIPERIYFDMNRPPPAPMPMYSYPAGPPVYYGPSFYYPPPYYYGPGVRVYLGPRIYHRFP